jgi:hypothetical protein
MSKRITLSVSLLGPIGVGLLTYTDSILIKKVVVESYEQKND